MVDIVIYHNPACGNSRGALALIREAGLEPQVVEYLKSPLPSAQIQALAKQAGVSVRALMREKEAIFQELGLADARWSDAELAAFVERHPILLNRPIVVSPLGTALCRPPELVQRLLPSHRPS